MTARTLFGLTLIDGLTWVMVLCAAVSLLIVVADLIPAKPRPDPERSIHTIPAPYLLTDGEPVPKPDVVVDRHPRVRTIYGDTASALAKTSVALAAHLEAVRRGGAQ